MIIAGIDIEQLEERRQSVDWRYAFYDPLHDHVEASTNEEKRDLGVMEKVIHELNTLYHDGEEGKRLARDIIHKYWQGSRWKIRLIF